MGTDKRARQKANRQARIEALEAETKAEQRGQTTRRWGLIGGVVAVFIVLFLLISTCGGDDMESGSNAVPTPVPESEQDDGPVEPEVPSLLSEVPPDFEPFAGTGALAEVEPAARNAVYASAPPMTIDPTASYAAVINTDVGRIRLELFASEAPLAVNNFVNLARDGFYDGVGFHRVLDGFMAQGGDPTGTGTGGPGYRFADEFDSGRMFDERGLLAMANSGPATNGSQFFITFVPTPALNGVHTIFGQLSDPDDEILDRITRRDPSSPDAASITPTLIESISILEG